MLILSPGRAQACPDQTQVAITAPRMLQAPLRPNGCQVTHATSMRRWLADLQDA